MKFEKNAPKKREVPSADGMEREPRFRVQRFICEELDRKATDALQAIVQEPAARARLLSKGAKVATAWLRAIPKKQSLRMDPTEWRQALGIHCDMPPPGAAWRSTPLLALGPVCEGPSP